jgi:hypothetical protein
VARGTRIAAFGSAAFVVVAGVLCAVLVGGLAGEIVGWALVTAGLGAALLLVFLEIGLGEDRARAEEDALRHRTAPDPGERQESARAEVGRIPPSHQRRRPPDHRP